MGASDEEEKSRGLLWRSVFFADGVPETRRGRPTDIVSDSMGEGGQGWLLLS